MSNHRGTLNMTRRSPVNPRFTLVVLVGRVIKRVPHISLVSREMWDAEILDLKCSLGIKRLRLAQQYPTSREKRARCGARRIQLTSATFPE
jgi:hypothetical protein